MMRMPSLRAAAGDARRVALRFPLVLASAVVAAVVSTLYVGKNPPHEPLMAMLAAATLGLALFTAIALAAERMRSRPLAIALGALGVVALAAFAVLWLQWAPGVRYRRYAQVWIGLHLLVAFLPYLRGREPNGFWQYNRSLFLRFLSAALHTAVLYVGLSVALLALNQLFKIRIPSETYLRLWVWVSFVFNTWFFLGGVPEDLDALEERRDYPRALKGFSQFILLPLVVVYLTILTAYLVRILTTGQWPSGWIGWLVSTVSTVGILSLLLVHPIRDQEENRWVATYTRWFYVVLLPSVGMLLVAIWKRVAQYGITEQRYFLAVLTLWLAGIAVTFIVRRRADIRWIPITLCILAFATLAGPLGAYEVSRRSQSARLRAMLERHGMIVDGVVRPAAADLPFDERKEISGAVRYLIEAHGTRAVKDVLGAGALRAAEVPVVPAFPSDTAKVATRYGMVDYDADAAMRALGLTYVHSYEGQPNENFNHSPWRPAPRAVALDDADWHVRLQSAPVTFAIEGREWKVRQSGRTMEVTPADQPPFVFVLDTLVAFARQHPRADDPIDPPLLVSETAYGRLTFAPGAYQGTAQPDTVNFQSLSGDLYLRHAPR